ncbi:MAG TPA: ATPase, T2SS/T4P/T4SS family [Phycisphaerales bacterium]|nr:ATPase, T2SS/T4P/T4SS family [Phycisphaerales bacterium]HMP37891.1 ATPase, T2SS/T4P/T4SS family [Phycisphaerales bacterium]
MIPESYLPLPALPASPLLLAAEAAILVDPIKAVLVLAAFIPWAWLISSRLEPDARYFHLNYHRWNGIHMAGGAAALIAVLAIPWFWLGLPVALLLLAAPILAYWKIRNKAVPEERRFRFSGGALSAKMEARRAKAAIRDARVTYIGPDRKPLPIPTRDDPRLPIHLLTEQMLEPAVGARANRVELLPVQGGYLISQVVDGVRYKRESVPAETANAAIDYLKSAAGLDVEDRRRRQVGQVRMRSGFGDTALDLAVSGTANGQSLRVDIERSKRVSRPFDQLGLLQPQVEPLAALLDMAGRHGVVLFAAPSGHGLTTTSYSLLSRHDAFTANIKTLERAVELRLDGVDHSAFDASNPAADYSTSLQSILRRDPDIVLVADLKDPGTGKVAAGPGIGGPLLYIAQQCDSAVAQWSEWNKAVGDPRKAAAALKVIMNQRLLRVVCPQCRQGYQPTPEQAKKLGLPAGKQHMLYRAGGKVQEKNKIVECPICNGIGYFGQTAVFEVMPIDDESRRLLAAGDFRGAYAVARRNRMIYLQEAALAKVRDGVTTVEEVARVLNPRVEAAPVPAAAQAS